MGYNTSDTIYIYKYNPIENSVIGIIQYESRGGFNNFLLMRWFQILETQYPHEVVSIMENSIILWVSTWQIKRKGVKSSKEEKDKSGT